MRAQEFLNETRKKDDVKWIVKLRDGKTKTIWARNRKEAEQKLSTSILIQKGYTIKKAPVTESKVADIKKLARAAAKKFKGGDDAASRNPHPADSYLGKVWRETFDKMLKRIPDEPITEDEDEDDTIICPVCDGKGVEYNETCVRCGGKGQLTADGEYIEETEELPTVKTYGPMQIAKKHGVPLKQIMYELTLGVKVEFEHTTNKNKAMEIALDHLLELPDYYTRLERMERGA